MSLPTTLQIPTPSAEEIKILESQKREVAVFSYVDKTVRVYVRAADETSDILGNQSDSLLFRVEDVWFIQTHSCHEDTIERSLAALFNEHTWQIVGHVPVLMVKQSNGAAWHGDVLSPNLFYNGVFSLFADWYDDCGISTKARLEFALEIRRDFRSTHERTDKMGYARDKPIRRIRESLFKKEDPKLYLKYDEYLHHYKQVLPAKGNETWARLRNYFREKAIRAAVAENIVDTDPILHAALAIKDSQDAAQPIGGLDEDWYTYGEDNALPYE